MKITQLRVKEVFLKHLKSVRFINIKMAEVFTSLYVYIKIFKGELMETMYQPCIPQKDTPLSLYCEKQKFLILEPREAFQLKKESS